MKLSKDEYIKKMKKIIIDAINGKTSVNIEDSQQLIKYILLEKLSDNTNEELEKKYILAYNLMPSCKSQINSIKDIYTNLNDELLENKQFLKLLRLSTELYLKENPDKLEYILKKYDEIYRFIEKDKPLVIQYIELNILAKKFSKANSIIKMQLENKDNNWTQDYNYYLFNLNYLLATIADKRNNKKELEEIKNEMNNLYQKAISNNLKEKTYNYSDKIKCVELYQKYNEYLETKDKSKINNIDIDYTIGKTSTYLLIIYAKILNEIGNKEKAFDIAQNIINSSASFYYIEQARQLSNSITSRKNSVKEKNKSPEAIPEAIYILNEIMINLELKNYINTDAFTDCMLLLKTLYEDKENQIDFFNSIYEKINKILIRKGLIEKEIDFYLNPGVLKRKIIEKKYNDAKEAEKDNKQELAKANYLECIRYMHPDLKHIKSLENIPREYLEYKTESTTDRQNIKDIFKYLPSILNDFEFKKNIKRGYPIETNIKLKRIVKRLTKTK